MARYDVAVIGLGGMGSAALATLARRGVRAVGVERFAVGHDRGSSHGETRIIRLGYFEHPSYVPLLRRSYELWRELEGDSGKPLLTITGILEIGLPDSEVVAGTLAASRLHGLPHEVLGAAELSRRFPFRVPPEFLGVWQPEGGFVAVEASIVAQIAQAKAAGADVRENEAVHRVSADAFGVRIETERGVIEADAAIVAAGAWAKQLIPGLPLRVTRQVMAWFALRDPAPFAADRFPVFLLESAHGTHYGLPADTQGRVKVAKHHHADQTVDPDHVSRDVTEADLALIRPAVAEHIPEADGPLIAAKTCLYTVTPDHDFIVDRLPGASNVIVASPCSGHGFKFAPVIGEIVADLAVHGRTPHDISRFALERFG